MVLFTIHVKEVAIIGPASLEADMRCYQGQWPCLEIIYLITLKLKWQRYVVN